MCVSDTDDTNRCLHACAKRGQVFAARTSRYSTLRYDAREEGYRSWRRLDHRVVQTSTAGSIDGVFHKAEDSTANRSALFGPGPLEDVREAYVRGSRLGMMSLSAQSLFAPRSLQLIPRRRIRRTGRSGSYIRREATCRRGPNSTHPLLPQLSTLRTTPDQTSNTPPLTSTCPP